jgi:hypothetical protein
MTVKLFSTNCPKCRALEKQLNKSKIEYELVTDRNVMAEKGFMSAPKLEVNGEIMDYMEAVKWAMNGGNKS